MGVLVDGFASTAFVEAEDDMVPIGGIIMWFGVIADIPSNYTHCNGLLGSPDMRDLFVRSASGSFPPHSTGGSREHTHTFTGDGHEHGVGAQLSIHGPGSENAWDADISSSTDAAAGTTNLANGEPPYYNLVYMMRIS